jgi:hypothetical protein
VEAWSDHFPVLRIWGRKLLLVGIFALFPIFIIHGALSQIEKLEVDKRISKQLERHVIMLARIKGLDSDSRMVVRSVSRMFGHVRAKSRSLQNNGFKRLRRLFPEELDLYVFDHLGKLIPEFSSTRKGRRAMELCFESLWEYRQTQSTRREGLLKDMFGFGEVVQIAAGFGAGGSKLGRRPVDSIVKWDRISSSKSGELSGFIALVHSGKLTSHRAVRGAISRANKKLPDMNFGLLDTSQGRWDFHPTAKGKRFVLREEILRAIHQYDPFFTTGTHFGAMNRRVSDGYLFSFTPKPRFFSVGFLGFMYTFSFLWFALVWFRVPAKGQGMAGRIPVKLVALFLFAVGTPALVLLVGGFYALKDHSHVLLQQLESRVQEKLQQFDDRLPSELTRLEGFLKRIIDRATLVPPGPERQKIFSEFLAEQVFDSVLIVNKKGDEVFNFPRFKEMVKKDAGYAGKQKFALIIGREVIKRLNNSMEIDSGTFLMEATTGLLNTLMGGKAVSLEVILGEFGRFQEMAFQGDGAFLFLDALPNPQGVVDHAVIATISGISFEAFYIKKHLMSLIKQPELKWRVSAIGDYMGKGEDFSRYTRYILSHDDDRLPALQIRDSVWQNRAPVKKVSIIKDQEEFWFGMRPQNLTKYTLIAAVSLKPLNERVQGLWMLLILVATLVVFSTAAIGMLLSEQFLAPIADLSLGILSIENRSFDYRVPIHAPDELGEMSGLMNNVLEGMKDLEVARIVQESLFPQGPIQLGEYVIFGKSRAMTDIGGDYLDYFQVGNDKIVGLIGDVSGHGVSAALIMGMAKCAFTMHEEHQDNLVGNLNNFSRFLLRTIKRKKMMTLFHFCLNVQSHVFTFGNAGHNFPFYHVAATKTVENLKQETFPLGMRLKVNYSTIERSMQPGDAILFYTDGLVEAKNLRQEVLDYSNGEVWFGEVANLAPEEVVNRLFDRFDEYTRGCPPEDDMSLICLKRVG